MKKLLFFISISFLLFSFSGCNKVEGPGGRATIKGKVLYTYVDASDQPVLSGATTVAGKEDVFIIYGAGNTYHDDDVETSYDGSFEFNYLEEGIYRVYLYEDVAPANSETSPDAKNIVFFDIEITEKKQVVDLGTITLKVRI